MAMTNERAEFLDDLVVSAVSAAYRAGWADEVESPGDDTTIRALDDDVTYTVTIATIETGLQRLSTPGFNYYNAGYVSSSYGDTAARFSLYDRTNGADSDVDDFDYDAILQAALFNELRYG